jgi:hypothetical protein
LPKNFFNGYGSGASVVYPNENYILVIQHPVTTEFEKADIQIEETVWQLLKFLQKNKL